jgi:hypothetical protein
MRGILSLLRREGARGFFEPADSVLAGAPVYILAWDEGLVLGAALALEVARSTFRWEALRGLGGLVLFNARSVDWALREARRRCPPEVLRAVERARRDYREQLRRLWRPLRARELAHFGIYDDEGAVAVVGMHPAAGFGNWVRALAHELLHHAFRHCPGRGENLRPLAEALLEACPSLGERFGSAEELAGDEVAALSLEEEALGFIAHHYFKEGAREPGPAEQSHTLAVLCFRLCAGERAFLKALRRHRPLELEPVSDGPLRRAAHELLPRWLTRLPADVYAERLGWLASAYEEELRRLAEEAPRQLRQLADTRPGPDLVFEGLRRLEGLGELAPSRWARGWACR